MRDIPLAEFLKAGVHFGHQVSRWHPKMRSYIFAARNGIYVIDLERTKERLESASAYVEDIAARNGTVMFIGTKRQAKTIVESAAKRVNMPFIINRWLGGTFTNFPTISQLIGKYKRLLGERERGELQKYTKKERLVIDEEIERLEKLVGGVSGLEKLPDAVFIVDLKQERTAVREAKKMGVPIIALADTNVNPTGIAYPIPANDDATKSVELIVGAIADAIAAGQARAKDAAVKAAEIPKPSEGVPETVPASESAKA